MLKSILNKTWIKATLILILLVLCITSFIITIITLMMLTAKYTFLIYFWLLAIVFVIWYMIYIQLKKSNL